LREAKLNGVMAETEFALVYDGPALADGRMAVRELAPALLALGDLFAEASVIAYPDREPVALDIKATAEGSFDVHLILHAVDAWDKIVQIFSSDAASALLQLKEYIILGGGGLFWLVRRLHGRKIEAAAENEPGRITLTLDDDTSIDIPTQVWELYQSVEVRKNAKRVVDPMTRSGVDSLEFRSDTEVTLLLTAADIPAYAVPDVADTPLIDQELEMYVSLASVAFTTGKWRLTSGDETFYAAVEDPLFLERVDQGEPFRKGDMLRCKMRLVQSSRGDGLHTERHVIEVLEHIPRTMQLRLEPPSQ